MPGLFGSYITDYVDMSRIGELLRSKNARYTKEQLIDRAVIFGATILSGFVASYLNDEKKTGCSSLVLGMSVSLGVFGLVHAAYVYPLIKKRWALHAECNEIIDAINCKLANKIDSQSSAKLIDKIEKVTTQVMQIDLADAKHSRTSQTWGYRKQLLGKLLEMITAKEATFFASKSPENIVALLKAPQLREIYRSKL